MLDLIGYKNLQLSYNFSLSSSMYITDICWDEGLILLSRISITLVVLATGVKGNRGVMKKSAKEQEKNMTAVPGFKKEILYLRTMVIIQHLSSMNKGLMDILQETDCRCFDTGSQQRSEGSSNCADKRTEKGLIISNFAN